MVTLAAAYPLKTSWQLQQDVWESNLEPWNNRSIVNWALYLYRGSGDTPWNNGASSFGVSGPGGFSGAFGAYRFGSTGIGTNYSGTPVGGRVLIASGAAWVQHAADGSLSVLMSASHAAAATLGTASIGATWITMSTLTQPPWPPIGVSAAYVSDSQVNVAWSNSYPTNGVPTVNEIDRSVNGAGFVRVANISPASSLLIGALPNQKIVARVHASNGAGGSGWSASSNAVFTTPAAPANVTATKDADLDITVAWTSQVAFVEHQHVVEHGTVLAGVTTWDGSPLGTVNAGVGSFEHVDPDPSKVHVYRVSAKNTDTAARQSSKVSSNTVQLLVAPNKPTFPALPLYRDKAADFVLPWTHNPVDTTPQSAYEVEYSTNAGSSWSSTGKVLSAVQSDTVPAGGFAADVTLTFRVRTWGQASSGGADGTGASPWSDSRSVTFKTRPVASIVSPVDASEWPEADLIVQLGFSQAEAASFVRATIRLLEDGEVLEQVVSTTLASTALATRLLNGGTYSLSVTVLDSNGLVSDPVESTFTVAYTLPVAAGVALTYLQDSGWVQLDLSIQPAGVGEAEAVSVTVTRTIDGETQVVIDRYPVTEPVVTILDTTPTIRGSNEYLVRTYSEDGATADVLAALVTAERAFAFLSSGPGYSDVVSVAGSLRISAAPSREKALFKAAGRRRAIPQFGDARSLEVSGSATLTPGLGSTPQEFEAFILDAGVVCYRDPSGRRMFGTVDGSVESPSSLISAVEFTVREADW